MMQIILQTILDLVPGMAFLIVGYAVFQIIKWVIKEPEPKVKYIVNTKYYKVMDIVN